MFFGVFAETLLLPTPALTSAGYVPHRTVREVVAIARRVALLLDFFMLYASIVILRATSHSSVYHLSLA
jgi:hypothetical protein